MSIDPLSPSRQIVFHQLLMAARKGVLMGALSEALGQIDPNEVNLVEGEPRGDAVGA